MRGWDVPDMPEIEICQISFRRLASFTGKAGLREGILPGVKWIKQIAKAFLPTVIRP